MSLLNPTQRKFLWFVRLSILWKVAALLALFLILHTMGVL